MALPGWLPKPIRWLINRIDTPFDRVKECLDFRVFVVFGRCYQLRIYNANMPEWDTQNYTHLRLFPCHKKNTYKRLYLKIQVLRSKYKNDEIDWRDIII